ncbi:AAA family ATPase [Erythrobacter sp. BLCC-B19]|uniref:AAA family ATPase n=1 Tax=Erythrobacter sp. BLCC-B19 TaxID=3025315 RepID=UPI002361768D|nr:AAA family ATPase [Erythrobacter sp. BLCC-B19]WDA41423.1 AAA family ATPase [Erythrobacter sp. BLCC-B19]
MREAEFKAWLVAQGYAPTSIATWLSDGRKVDGAYGLDEQFDRDGGASILAEMAYSRSDDAAGRRNPSAIDLNGSFYANLAACRAAARAYFRFRNSEARPQGRFGELDREAVLEAVGACDAVGDVAQYVAALELGQPTRYWLVLDGKRYPSKAIVRDALARRGSEWLPGGGDCKTALERLGFVVIDWPELNRARDAFLRQMPDFTDFRASSGAYWDVERAYKNGLIEQAKAIVARQDDDRAIGESLYRLLSVGGSGLPLSWRTLSEVQNADPALRDRFYTALGLLARSDAPLDEAIPAAARELEVLREAGIAGLRRGEVLSIPITVWATLHPDQASWFKIAKIDEMGRRLFGRRLFPQTEFREADLAEWLQLMRALFGLLDKEFGWHPQDMFDVQGFIWVVGNPDAPRELDPVPTWLVTSLWGQEDGLPRFVERGEWSLLTDTGSANNRRVREMQVGDRIFLKDFVPRARDLPFDAGTGIVTALRFRAEGTITEVSDDGLRVGVDWQAWPEPRTWFFYTNNDAVWRLRDPGDSVYADQLRRFLLDGEPQDHALFLNDPFWRDRLFGAGSSDEMPTMQPTNLILYGPPGTGKTYRTAQEAVRLCGEAVPEDRDALMQRYEELSKEGRIRFVTFHQSFSYEEFVEGLRPETAPSDGQEGQVGGFRLEPRPGIFRELCAVAGEAAKGAAETGGAFDFAGRNFWKMGLGQIGVEDSVYDACIAGDYVALGWGGDVDWSDARFASLEAIREEWASSPRENEQPSNVTQLHPFRNTMKVGDIVIVPFGNKAFRAVGEVVGEYYFAQDGDPTYYHRRRVRWLKVLDEALPLDTIIEGDFMQRTFYSIAAGRVNREALARLVRPVESEGQSPVTRGAAQQFVLIIDEINRANVSKVFGELITLIEPDKRLGMRNALKVRLPYSKREFGVPANLHIIGTMNTADRSIALLDTALRRRFRFEEMAPDTSIPAFIAAEDSTGLPLGDVLNTMNRRIEYLVDRDHRIGHAFFIDCKTKADADAVMRDKVIPLLQEYFFDDWNRLAAVLGEKDKGGNFLTCDIIEDPMGEGGEPLKSWRVRSHFDEGAYTRLISARAASASDLENEA